MYKKNDKRRIYWLIDQYISSKINARTFCDEFYYSYDLEIDRACLNINEIHAFSRLAAIVNRFSEFTNDHKQYPGAYFNEEQLRQKIIETRELLQK